MEIELRNERFSDYPETENVVREAFWNRYSPGCYEHYLIHIMRYSRAFVPQLDFVAVFDDKIVGNIVFLKSVIQADTGKEYEVLSLGPISVLQYDIFRRKELLSLSYFKVGTTDCILLFRIEK